MKRVLATLLALILLVGFLPANQAEAAVTTATVKGGWLRLRASASFDAATITSYYTGTKMTVLGTSGAWYHVAAPDGRTGYMYGSYLTIGSAGSENTAATVVSANGLDVRLRSGPSTAYGVIGLYSVGTKATILSSGTYWHYISIGGQKGYMMSQYLSTDGTSVAPPAADGYIAYVTSKNGLGVRLRSGAGTGYGVLGVYSVGTQVTVLKHNNTWDYIRVGSRTGYMMNEFLTTSSVPVPPVEPGSYTAYVTSSNGLPVKLRSGAGTGYSVLGKYAVGTEVTVLKHNNTWDYIRVKTADGYIDGYMMNEFLVTKVGTTQISHVSINQDTAYPGITLSASVTPIGASVTYEWADDKGLLLSTQASYTVRDADVGRKVRVRVTGANGYTGTAVSAYVPVSKAPSGGIVLEGVAISSLQPKVGDTLSAKTDPYTESGVAYTWTRDDGLVVGTAKAYTVQPGDVGHALYCMAKGIAANGVSGTVTSAWTAAVAAADKPVDPETPDTIQLKNVTISNTLPKVGDTLSARTDPATDSVVYTWVRDDGVVLGSGSAYTVPADTEGHGIYCVAAGLGNVKGTVQSAVTAAVAGIKPAEPEKLSGTVKIQSAIMPGVEISASVAVNCKDIGYQWYVNGEAVSSAASLKVTSDMAGKTITLVVYAVDGSGYTGKVESNACSVIADSVASSTEM